MGKPYQKTKLSSLDIIRTLLHRIEWFRNGLPNFVVVVQAQKTILIPGRPNEITTPEMINKIHDIVLNDPKVKVREISEIVSI